ncbi:MAG: protein kinase [Planctomycetes bacterium]|nr:protein kinase [Planctomycetota bacterium]
MPEKIGRFEIRSRLGSGGFGTVYRAHDPVLEREVALKVPRAAVLESPKAKARFLREPKAAAQLQHPHIVPIFDAGTDGEHYYIAYAFIEGRTLQQVIADRRPDVLRAAEIVRHLAEALEYAHTKGVIHRDIKPANIMIDADGQPMLMDFGIAHLEGSKEKFTQDGAVIGTPAYMSPEQADASFGEIGPAVDQYGLGVVLYELLVGQTPFSGPPGVLIHNLVHQDPAAPRKANPAVPRDLDTICLKAMSKAPADRYPSCKHLADDLQRWIDDKPITARPIGVVERLRRWCRRNPKLALLSGLTALLLVGALVAVNAYLHSLAERNQEASRREQAESRRDQADAARQEVETELQRAEAAHQASLSALQQLETERDRATTAAERAEAGRQVAEARLRVAEAERRLSEVRAPSVDADGTQPDSASGSLESDVSRAPDPESQMAKPEPRHMENEILRERAEAGQLLWTVEGHTASINAVVFSPKGLLLASASDDRTVKLWGSTGGDLQRTWKTYSSAVWSLAFSPDGRALATASLSPTIKVWDLTTGNLRAALGQNDSLVYCVATSLDGSMLASGDVNEMVKLWDATTTELRHTLHGHTDLVRSVALSRDGRLLASGSHDKTIVLWNPHSGKRSSTFRGHAQGVNSVAFSPDGALLASGGNDATIVLWEVSTGKIRQTLQEHSAAVIAVAFSPDGSTLASASLDKSVLLWDVQTGNSRGVFSRRAAGVRSVAFSADGTRVATADGKGRINVWSLH